MKRPFVKRTRRDGITLLEVILAIAILGSSMVMIANLFVWAV